MPVTSKWVHSGVILAAMVLVLSITVLILGAAKRGATDVGLPGAVAPAFTLKDTAGQTYASSSLDGKVTFLVFAGRRDDNRFSRVAGVVNALAETYASDANVALIALQYDTEQSIMGREDPTPGVMQRTLKQITVLLDTDAAAARSYRVSEEPTAFVIDRKGVIRNRIPLANESARLLCNEALNALRNSDAPVGVMAANGLGQ